MADRFYGSVDIGGNVTEEHFDKLSEMLDELCEDYGDCGSWNFAENAPNDFREVIDYCIEKKIALCITWEGKWEYDACADFWIDGKHQVFMTDHSGSIAVKLENMRQESIEVPQITLAQYISSLNIPDFPELQIIDSEEVCEYCGNKCTDENGCDAHISEGGSALPSVS